MVIELLELCEIGFRQAGLHRSGSDLEALRISFLAQRAPRQDVAQESLASRNATADVERAPRRRTPRRRQLTIYDALDQQPTQMAAAAPAVAASRPLALGRRTPRKRRAVH